MKNIHAHVLENEDDLQMLQPGQVSEGTFFNHPQTVDIPHRSAERKGEIQEGISTNYPTLATHTRRSFTHQPSWCEGLKAQFGG